MAELRFKLSRIVSRHQQMKVAFDHLKSQIKIGLLEAEDVFQSLAIPLMSLVGLKTVEMAEEGRFSTIFTTADLNTEEYWRNEIRSDTQLKSPRATKGRDEAHQTREQEEESYTAKAAVVSKEFLQKQKWQLMRLIHLLRKIETQVNSGQDDILQTLAHHQVSIHKFFQNAIAYIAAVHQTGQNHGTFLIALKLFKVTLDRMDAALGSVERGIEHLVNELAEQMCTPMVEYVKGLKAEMTTGTCPRLLGLVEEMRIEMRNGKLELEEARKKVRVAEERKLEALCRLKELEERIRRMEHLGFFLEAKEPMGHCVPHKFLGMEEDQAKDERSLWKILKMKRKHQIPESPFGPQELLCRGQKTNHLKSTRERSPISSRPISRNYLHRPNPHTPWLDSWLPLGSSPSVATQQVLSRKHVTH
ncbi:hypothetical protein U1Q18_006957 [Sarracenia purpurea var. burkii]